MILRGMARERSLLAALALMREYVGPIFQINLPKFHPAVFVGPELESHHPGHSSASS